MSDLEQDQQAAILGLNLTPPICVWTETKNGLTFEILLFIYCVQGEEDEEME